MMKYLLLLAWFALLADFTPICAQDISISYKNPDELVVCSADTLSITVQNNTAAPISGGLLDLELPPGLEYLPGALSGATESDISNLEKPVFALPELLPGQPITVRVQLSATCDLVEAINSAQLFSALLRVRAGAITEQRITTKFQIQTSLLVITQVDNSIFSGEKGDIFTRTLHVRNTRLGPVRHLFLRDAHPAGISIQVVGATTQQDQPELFTAYFDGTYFTQFGDGDDLLEFGETALIQQQITITDCGFPAYSCRSNIAAEWSCTNTDPPCQGDSLFADVQIKPSSYQPKLTFETEYALPWDHCAELPHQMRLRVINEGAAEATNIILQINSEAPTALGMDKTSFQIQRNGVTTALPPNLTEDHLMDECGVTNSAFVTLFIPEMQANDTAYITFDAFYCLPACKQLLPLLRLNYYYKKPCPIDGFIAADTVAFQANLRDYLSAGVTYEIGDCMEDEQTYPFFYRINSHRLISDTGYLWLKFDLPIGLEWSPDCPVTLGGDAPVLTTITPMTTVYPINRVLLAFKLPLPDTFLAANFCLKNTCRDDASYVWIGPDEIASGDDFTLYEPQACFGCGYKPDMAALLSLTLDADIDCAVPACESFELQTTCTCPPDGPFGPPGGTPVGPDTLQPPCITLREYKEAYRLNYDLADNDDDRRPDLNGLIDLNKVRRDRFLPGDTLRNLLSTKIVCGDTVRSLFYQLFTEVIASDFGYAGVFDTFFIGPLQTDPARYGFTDMTKIEIAAAEFTIWDSSANVVYTCPITTVVPLDQLYGEVAFVNTKPSAKIDELATMNYPFNPVIKDFINSGCLPADFILRGGDSVQLRVDLKFDMNYTPRSNQHYPPLINFEMGYNANNYYRYYNYRHYDTLMFQYSGYVDSLISATFGIKPCEPSNQVTPFAYDIRIARDNLFPYEVRPMSKITKYDLIVPPGGLVPLSAELLFLNLHTNIPIQQNLPLPFSIIPDSMLTVDFSPAYQIPPDEGYGLRSKVVFEPNCLFTAPDSSAQYVTLDFPGCMSRPDPVTYLRENQIGFYSNHPRDTMTTIEAVLDFNTEQISALVLLENKSAVAASHAWVHLVNPEGGLTDLKITVIATGQVISPVNGLYQLGALPIFGKRDLNITGTNNSCEQQRLWVIYGWDCQPYLNPELVSCGAADTLELLLRPRKPEIELELVDFPVNVPLCDTSDYFVFELSNADLGYAYLPFLNIELPQGLQLVSGSCQISYPVGSTFVNIPDPANLGNNLLEWNLVILQDSIAANGLPGVNLDPKNALQIRFKVLTGCGAVSNAQLIFGARAEWYCGKQTNTLRKASDPILVEGLEPSYEVEISVTAQGSSGQSPCASEQTMAVSMLISGPALPGDSIYLNLPPGYTYVPGSYVQGLNAPPGPPQLFSGGLRWQMPAGLPANSVIAFTFKIRTPIEPHCEGVYLRIQTRQQIQAFCPSIAGDCSVYVATGEAGYYFPPVVAQLALNTVSLTVLPDGKVNYLVSITNYSSTLGQALEVIQFFYDTDHNGQYNSGDELLYTYSFGNLNLVIQPGGTVQIPVNGLPAPDSLCNILVVLPAVKNCICPTNSLLVLSNTVNYAAVKLCTGQSTIVGVDSAAGHTYSWSGAPNLPCTDCPKFLYEPPATGLYQLNLEDQGAACLITHRFEVEVFDPPVLEAGNTNICQGQNVSLKTSTAVTWNWQGPGVSSPNVPVQTLMPQASAWYFVTATNAAGCELTDSVFVMVSPTDTTDLGILRTCEGTPVDVFGTLTETPGLYTRSLTNIHGCDSLVLVNLEIVPHTEETLARCPRDTVIVFGVAVTEPGLYCDTLMSSIGCDSIHCIVVSDYIVPLLSDPDTFYITQGTSIVLPGPAGYQSYHWMPGDYLNCTDCQSPTASPPDTIEYTLTLTTSDGCPDTVIYRVVPLPPCDPARIRVPNAFTPDNDGVNDTFTAVPYEGNEVITRLTIYNRWGQKVYEVTGPNAAWDGTTSGKPAPSDVYVWLLEVLCDGDGIKFRKGDVTVLR